MLPDWSDVISRFAAVRGRHRGPLSPRKSCGRRGEASDRRSYRRPTRQFRPAWVGVAETAQQPLALRSRRARHKGAHSSPRRPPPRRQPAHRRHLAADPNPLPSDTGLAVRMAGDQVDDVVTSLTGTCWWCRARRAATRTLADLVVIGRPATARIVERSGRDEDHRCTHLGAPIRCNGSQPAASAPPCFLITQANPRFLPDSRSAGIGDSDGSESPLGHSFVPLLNHLNGHCSVRALTQAITNPAVLPAAMLRTLAPLGCCPSQRVGGRPSRSRS